MTVLSILYHPGRRLDQFNLGAHFLDLGGLLTELGCESLYLFLLLRERCLLLRDRCLQLLNFVIEHGLALGLGADARLRCATMRRSRCVPPLATPGSKDPAPIPVREVADADRIVSSSEKSRVLRLGSSEPTKLPT